MEGSNQPVEPAKTPADVADQLRTEAVKCWTRSYMPTIAKESFEKVLLDGLRAVYSMMHGGAELTEVLEWLEDLGPDLVFEEHEICKAEKNPVQSSITGEMTEFLLRQVATATVRELEIARDLGRSKALAGSLRVVSRNGLWYITWLREKDSE